MNHAQSAQLESIVARRISLAGADGSIGMGERRPQWPHTEEAQSKLRCISHLDGTVRQRTQPDERETARRGAAIGSTMGVRCRLGQSHASRAARMNESARIVEEYARRTRGRVRGRNMFGPRPRWCLGPTSSGGLVGRRPSLHYLVFILTQHPRDPVEMEGGPRSFVHDGIESAARNSKGGTARRQIRPCFGATPTSLGSTWKLDCRTNLSSTRPGACSATVLASSTTSGARRQLEKAVPRGARRSRTSSTGGDITRVAERRESSVRRVHEGTPAVSQMQHVPLPTAPTLLRGDAGAPSGRCECLNIKLFCTGSGAGGIRDCEGGLQPTPGTLALPTRRQLSTLKPAHPSMIDSHGPALTFT